MALKNVAEIYQVVIYIFLTCFKNCALKTLGKINQYINGFVVLGLLVLSKFSTERI